MATQQILKLSDLTGDVTQFIQQFQAYLVTKPSWVGNLTTQTSETLVELISSVGAFAQGRLIRKAEDAFSETAQSDSAILAITQMQGLRIARYLPASGPATISSPVQVTLPPLTQFTCGGSYFFNRTSITLPANTPTNITAFQGQVFSYAMNGLGTENQTYVAAQDKFVISDLDTQVEINNVLIPKSYGGLWNFDGLPGYTDLTLNDGRLLLQFGNLGGINGNFGTIPQVNDNVVITYVVTAGASGNNIVTSGQAISVTGFPLITGTMTDNPQGGADNKPVIAYKNIASGGFGTYSSAVTKSQYQAIIGTYPGILDAVTQAQREINPQDYRWMNVIRVSALTSSTWSQTQINEFLAYCQSVTMYSGYFLWQEPVAIARDIELDVYVFNSADPSTVQANTIAAIQNLFAPRPGLLMTNFYGSDLEALARQANPGLVSYTIVKNPTGPMIVTAPNSPQMTYNIVPGGGTLGPLVYAYGIATTLTNGQVGSPSNWVFPQITGTTTDNAIQLSWPAVDNAQSYQLYGRAAGTNTLGLLATLTSSQLTFTDNGSITPTGTVPSSIAAVPIQYNSLNSLVVNVYYAERQQRLQDASPTRSVNF